MDVRLAIVSDIHSNLPALDVVLEQIAREGVDQVLCAGDIVGYGPHPNQVIERLKKIEIMAIQGNHDRAVLAHDSSNMNIQAQDAVWWTIGELKPEGLDYLSRLGAQLSFNWNGLKVAIFHGSPRNPDEYVPEEGADQELLELAKCDLLVLGHTHVPFVKSLDRGTIVNPGSVGQPRDGDPRASLTIYDHRLRRFEVKRLAYDIDAVAEAMRESSLPSFLSMRLYSGI
ncbi:MAG: metallophosphatase family protein [Methanomassiliicoccales archaeon]|nr:metallophosphatase family protein [Methanomassiliicoccales archaeon]